MAFSQHTSELAASLRRYDNLLLYTTRGCFGSPARDPGRVIGHATVRSTVAQLDEPVTFGDRTFPVGCTLSLHLLTPFGDGLALLDYVPRMHVFPNPNFWSAYMRRTLVALDEHDYDLLLRPLKEIGVAPKDAIPEYVAQGTPRRRRRPRSHAD
jgi:hypothetical protein